MRILYVYSGKAQPTAAGLDLVVRQQVQALTEAGHRVFFLARGRFRHPLVRNFTLPITPANLISSLPSKYYYNAQHRFFSQLGAWIVAGQAFDAIIGWNRQGLSLFRAANARGIPCFLNCPSMHHDYPVREPNLGNWHWPYIKKQEADELYRRADVLLTASEYASYTFLANGIPADKITSIGRAADVARFRSQERQPKPFRAVFFGRLSERKGIFQVMEAWQQAAIADGELWIIGSIPKEIAEEVQTRLPANATLFGHRNDAETLLSQCHVQLLLTKREGMAKSLVEGAACGLVTLTTPESGFPVQEGKTGFFVGRNRMEEVSERLRQLATAPEQWHRMSQESVQFVHNHLTWEAFRARFLAAVHQHMTRIRKVSPRD